MKHRKNFPAPASPPPPPFPLLHLFRPKKLLCRGESPNSIVKLSQTWERRNKNKMQTFCRGSSSRLSHKMASLNRKQWEWRRPTHCFAFYESCPVSVSALLLSFLWKSTLRQRQRESCVGTSLPTLPQSLLPSLLCVFCHSQEGSEMSDTDQSQ